VSFSFLSEAVVLFTVPAVFWHLLIVRGVGGAGSGALARTAAVGLVLTGAAYVVVRHGALGRMLPDLPWLPLATVSGAAIGGWLLRDRLLGAGVPQQLLISVQLFRPIGMIFVLEDVRGVLPSSFAQPAGWGDLLAGLTAAAVLLRYPAGRVPPRAVILVAVVGIVDFVSAFFFGFTSSETPIQLFAFDNPNRVLEWPLGLIPVFLVPYALVAHLLSLTQLRRDLAAGRAGGG
jgi:hypothetical protein